MQVTSKETDGKLMAWREVGLIFAQSIKLEVIGKMAEKLSTSDLEDVGSNPLCATYFLQDLNK